MKFELLREDDERWPWQSYKVGDCPSGTTYKRLVKCFGKPLGPSADGKVDVEWAILFEDGTFATIHNYKTGPEYLGKNGIPVDQITEWSIGGYTPWPPTGDVPAAVNHVLHVLNG
jgi:hypothetical protein